MFNKKEEIITTERFTTTPHPDIELGFGRNKLEYFLSFPESGVNADTGVILVIPGFGDWAASDYQKDKLRPYLANKYNCIAVGVNYFGIGVKIVRNLRTGENFLECIEKIYGVRPNQYVINENVRIDILFKILKEKGVKKIDHRCYLLHDAYNGGYREYQSFGFLPAIDHLNVLGEILKRYNINKRKIIAFGSSYGGYIALLLGKFAPNTFSVIIDNSGYVKSQLNEIADRELLIPHSFSTRDLQVYHFEDNPWTIFDKASPFFFSDSCKCIRSLQCEEHIKGSKTRYYIFHSERDKIIPIAEKDMFVDMLRKHNTVNYFKVNEQNMDGSVFKNLDHAMKASLRGIFDLVSDFDDNGLEKDTDLTDFDLNSVYTYNCGEKSYVFSFNNNFDLNVKLSTSESPRRNKN